MKKLLSVLLTAFISGALTAQTITITFGAANKNRNLQAVIDGTSYYSNSTANTNTAGTNVKTVTLNNIQFGSHSLEVFRMRNDNGNYANGTANNSTNGNAIYSNTFQLRQGYDMSISIQGGGQVSFSEKKIRNRNNNGVNAQTRTPISDADFNQLSQTIRGQWNQATKISTLKSAFNSTGTYFTTNQVRQLLLLARTESSRLDLAKLAYQKTTDPINFNQVNDVFSNTSSRDDLNLYIRNNPNNYGNTNTGSTSSSYRAAMADADFNQLYQRVNNHFIAADKVRDVRESISTSNSYFSTAQIRSLLLLASAETDRLSLAKLAWFRISDQSNFSSLYDLLSSQSGRDELNTYVVANGGTSTGYSNTQYNTRAAMPDASFTQLLQKAGNHFLPWDKLKDVKEAFNNTGNYFTTYQIRQLLSLISSENDKLETAKLGWSRVIDPANFMQLADLFSNQQNRDALNNYIIAHPL